jgi:tetratricopeptide (TPR) repeat protein
VEVESQSLRARVPFRAGQIAPGDEAAEDVVAQAIDLATGTFTIRSAPVDFSALAGAAAPVAHTPTKPPSSASVMGRLSGVKANNRLFQVQTEFSGQPEPCVVTVVILDGRTVLKRVSPPLPGRTREAWQQAVQEQHAVVEAEVEAKVVALQEKSATLEPRRKSAASLVEDGLARYLEKDYAGALVHWEEALKLDPDNKSVAINVQVARKKLAESA